MILRVILALSIFQLISCYDETPPKKEKGKEEASDFVFQEAFVSGSDTGVVDLTNLTEAKISTLLCQEWNLKKIEGSSEESQVWTKDNERIFPGFVFFPDSIVVENPHDKKRIGTWTAVSSPEGAELQLTFSGGVKRILLLKNVTAKTLLMQEVQSGKEPKKWIMEATGKVLQNYKDNPFYPDHIQWMFRPKKKESDAELFSRVRAMVWFYGLYYRYNIKMNADVITYKGLPEVFVWYNRGIGLPEKGLIETSFVNCFYNKDQANKAYDFLRKLLVDYEYKWPKKQNVWLYATHDVLGQMVHKIDSLQRF